MSKGGSLMMMAAALVVGCGSDERPGMSTTVPMVQAGAQAPAPQAQATATQTATMPVRIAESPPAASQPTASDAAQLAETPVSDPGIELPSADESGAMAQSTLPCNVATIMTGRCGQCHGASTVGGAPMSLTTLEDFHKPSYSDPARLVYELVQERINDEARPMPPGSLMPDPDLSVLNTWLGAGAKSGTVADANCPAAEAVPTIEMEPETARDPNEECFELRMHGAQSPGDTSEYTIESGEYYNCFYYKVPWDKPVEGTRFGNAFENEALLHHWLLYTTNSTAGGTFERCTGSHIGDNSQLLAGWAVGGRDVEMPPQAGFELPPPGSHVLVEWHLFNTTGRSVGDSSGIQVCTIPKGTREHTATMATLGTEDFNGFLGMPPGVESTFSGTCRPSRQGMNAGDPIHIFTFLPHMHKLGRSMRSVVNRGGGATEEVFNKPFDFNQQIHYEVAVDLFPGDTITSTCTFFNNTGASVAYGPSSEQEMCYQFAISYPAGALKNGAFGLNGATNNCW